MADTGRGLLGNALGDQPIRRRRFPLTPLADALFQLLTFFMLTTSLQSFSLLGLRAGELPAGTGPGPAPASAAPTTAATVGTTVLWTLGPGMIRVRGQEYGMEALGGLVEGQSGVEGQIRVVLLVLASARVEDLVTVLEAWSTAEDATVEISMEGS